MSAIWKIGLFTKLSATEAKCGACERTIQMTDRSTKGLFKHARTHEEFANKLKEVEENQASQKNSMDLFVKIVPQGRHRYSDRVMPRMYRMVKLRIKEFIDVCPALSFTSDIWSGPTESFIRHTQCPEASPFHWFVCCGKDGIECCGGIQTWAYVVLGSVLLSVLTILTFYLLLHFQVICAATWPGEDGEKREDSPCTLLSTSSATPPSSPCSYSPGSNISSTKPIRGDSNSCLSSLVVVVEDHSKEGHT